jgi:hypothetical protein
VTLAQSSDSELTGIGALPDLSLVPRTQGVLDNDALTLAVRLVDNMGVLEELAVWKAAETKGPGGRPATFSNEALLVALVACAITDQPLHLMRVRDVMFRQLSPQWRSTLGIPDPPAEHDTLAWDDLYRNVRTRFHGMIDLMDPSSTPKNRRLDFDSFIALADQRRAERSDEEREARYERLEWFVNRILEASVALLSREVIDRFKGSVAVDATLVRSHARAQKQIRRSRSRGKPPEIVIYSADPDAAFYVREGDHRDDNGDVPGSRGRDKVAWGFEATLVISGEEEAGAEQSFPNLALGMAVLHKPGHSVGRNGAKALASVRDRGHPAGFLAADRAYSSAKAEHFQLPALALGYRVVFDYKNDQLGVKASSQGFVQIEGEWYCPSITQPLIDATSDFRDGIIDEATYQARLKERWGYRARPKGRADAEGHVRLLCPAANPWPMARCDLKPASVRAETRGRIRIHLKADVAANPPPSCTQQTVTIPPEAGAKFRQDLLYGSVEWHATYSRLRNTVEGFNGYVKDPAHEALDDPGRRRVHGVAAQSLLTALLLMAANVRKIRAFQLEAASRRTVNHRDRPRRRRTASVQNWRPHSPQVSPTSTAAPLIA